MADHSIQGKTVLIAGGAKNLGGLIARDLARHGARAVAIHYNSDVTRAAAEETVAALKAAGAQAVAFRADLRRAGAMEALFADVVRAVGRPDIAINTIGKVLKKPFTEITEAEYDDMAEVNAKTAFFFLREAGKHVNDHGRIVTLVTSLLGAFTPFYAAYAGTKAPVEHFTRAAAKEFGARGISVTAVGRARWTRPSSIPPRATMRWPTTRPRPRCRPSAAPGSPTSRTWCPLSATGQRRLVDHRTDHPDQRRLHHRVGTGTGGVPRYHAAVASP